MARSKNIFQISPRSTRLFTWGDLLAILLIDWGHYAELLAYDDRTETISLVQEMVLAKTGERSN
jgi:hypothetical protein